MIDLWPDMLTAARNLRPAHLARLGISQQDALAAGGLGAAKINTFNGGLFEFGGALSAMILPVFWSSIPTEDAPVDDGDLIDLLAFNSKGRWLRRGDAALLGAGALADQLLGKPLHAFRTPLSWLQAGCDGVVVLDINQVFIDLVTAPNGLVGEDDVHTDELRGVMTETVLGRFPRFLVRQREAA